MGSQVARARARCARLPVGQVGDGRTHGSLEQDVVPSGATASMRLRLLAEEVSAARIATASASADTNLLRAASCGSQRGHPARERRKKMATKKSTSKPSTPPKYRRADTGEYTTKRYADKHPKTTVKESK